MLTIKKFNGVKDYKKISHLPFNREFTLRPDLIESIQKNGFITVIYCCYSKAFGMGKLLYLLDGQNRALAAQYLDIPFQVGILEVVPETPEELVELTAIYNNTSVAWRLDTYCKAYASIGKLDYLELVRLGRENGQYLNTIATLLSGNIARSIKVGKSLKKGTFKILARESTLTTLDLARTLEFKMSGRMLLAFHHVRLTKDKFMFDKFRKSFNKNYQCLVDLKLDDFTDKFLSMGS